MLFTSLLFLGISLSLHHVAQAATVPVKSAADFASTQAGPVVYELQNDITTDSIAVANAGGVRITSAPGNTFTITSTASGKNLLLVEQSHDVQIDHIKLQSIVGGDGSNGTCEQTSAANPRVKVDMGYVTGCSAIHVSGSTNVLITDASIFGRISASSVNDLTIRFSDISTNFLANGIDMMSSGTASQLANITIQNNNIHDTSSGILLSSIGVQILNNVIDGYQFTGVQIDTGVHNTCTTGWIVVESNYIRRLTGIPHGGDGSGIYMDTHWCSASILVRNNFLWNEDPADTVPLIYLDYVTSNQRVENNVVYNVAGSAAAKLNTGHLNQLIDNVAINARNLGNVGCENGGEGDRNNCANDIGQFWFQHGMMNTAYMNAIPWFASICSEKSFQGIACTTTAAADEAFGGCSGVPHGNVVQWIVGGDMGQLYSPAVLPASGQQGIVCSKVPGNNADLLNTFTSDTFAGAILSSPPTRTSLPVLSPGFIQKYPAFANFNANLGPSGQTPPPVFGNSTTNGNNTTNGNGTTNGNITTNGNSTTSGSPTTTVRPSACTGTPKATSWTNGTYYVPQGVQGKAAPASVNDAPTGPPSVKVAAADLNAAPGSNPPAAADSKVAPDSTTPDAAVSPATVQNATMIMEDLENKVKWVCHPVSA